jgi:hypothetical protein
LRVVVRVAKAEMFQTEALVAEALGDSVLERL